MISNQDFIRILSIENNLINAQTKDLTQADTLIQPQPSGNCMNWVLGHLLENQILMLETLGKESPVTQASLERYQRESSPVQQDEPGIWSLEQLLAGHQQVNEALIAALGTTTEEDFARQITIGERTMTVGWRLFFLYFHFTYHVGQLELLRQLAGKTEKVI